MLFRCWKAVFCFDKALTFSAHVTFGEASRPICGSAIDVLDQIDEMCNFLQECLDAWVQHVDQQRRTYHHLNYFSPEQLVMIQTELARLGKNGTPNKCVYPLLAAIKDNATYEELQQCLKQAFVELEEDKKEELGSLNRFAAAALAEKKFEEELAMKQQAFTMGLLDAGMEREVVERALQVCDLDDIQEGEDIDIFINNCVAVV
jgi:hypothetical protein